MKKAKKLLSILLAILMLATTLPIAVSAATTVVAVVYPSDSNVVYHYDSFKDAYDSVRNMGGRLQLRQDLVLEETLVIDGTLSISYPHRIFTLDLADFTITGAEGVTTLFQLTNGAGLTIKSDVKGKIDAGENVAFDLVENSGSKLYIDGGTFIGSINYAYGTEFYVFNGIFPEGYKNDNGQPFSIALHESSNSLCFDENHKLIDASKIGSSYTEYFYVEKHDHVYENYVETTEETCESNAYETGTCKCGHTNVREVADTALGHDWNSETAQCNRCSAFCHHNEIFNHTYEIIRPVYDEATGEWSKGYIYFDCNICDYRVKTYDGDTMPIEAERADYSKFDKAYNDILALYAEYEDELTNDGKFLFAVPITYAGTVAKDYIVSDYERQDGLTFNEQSLVDEETAKLESNYATLVKAIEDEAIIKADFSEIDKVVEEFEEKVNATENPVLKEILEELLEEIEELKNGDKSQAAIDKVLEEINEYIAKFEDCLKGEHTINEYTDDNNATCSSDATKTGYCEICGTAHSIVIEGTRLEHSDEDEDDVCDLCGVCTDCGNPAHTDIIGRFICLMTTFIKLVKSFFLHMVD